ncbi:MAG: hypothetical protein FJ271_05065 [Planctomycetes bacterium]|nr:hypothetical protein [Planctomycetota bacterium]
MSVKNSACIVMIWILSATSAVAEDAPKKKVQAKEPTLADTRAALGLAVDAKLFNKPMNLKEVLEILLKELDKRGKKVRIKVNVDAIKNEFPDEPSIYDTQFILKTKSKSLPLGSVLSYALAPACKGNVTFKVRRGIIEITTLKDAARKN